VKLDNLIQVAHNVEIGENTVIAAQVGISGSTKFGKNVMIGGQAGITGHLTIADGVKIQAQAAVIRDVTEKGKGISGAPAIEAREHYRILASMKILPQLIQRVKELEKKLEDKS
jgi:UDP-3-O-[3-hydroxymyristoyl] glucosamine N-acyltransferase